MQIKTPFITIQADVKGKKLTYRVVEQIEDFNKNLKLLGGVICDDETGLSLKSNKKPSFNHNVSRFFVRGSNKKYDNQEVVCNFESNEDAIRSLNALQRLCEGVTEIKVEMAGHGSPVAGNISHVRFNFLNREMATFLKLTGHKLYPVNIPEWTKTKPIITVSRHFTEHLAQAIDVLNKSIEEETEGNVMGRHHVTPAQAKKAKAAFQKFFQEAHENGYLVAAWRLASGIRSIDVEEDPKPKKKTKKKEAVPA